MADDLMLPSPCDGSSHPSSSVGAGSEENGSREKARKHYLHKSLDWHSDFFTSEGVLNQEELAIINRTFKKAEASSLCTIHEDSEKSVQQHSTFGDDSWTLEKLEVQLFETASATRRVLHTGGKALKSESSSKKNNPTKGGPRSPGASVRFEQYSQNKKYSAAAEWRGVINNRHLHTSTSRGAAVSKGDSVITNSKTVSKPSSISSTASLLTPPAKRNFASENSQTRTSSTEDKSRSSAMQKFVVLSKKGNGGPRSASSTFSESSKSTLTSVSNSSVTAHQSALEKTWIMNNCTTTLKRSSSGLIANRASSISVANKASSFRSLSAKASIERGSRITNTSTNNLVTSTGSLKLSLSISPSGSCESFASLPSLSTLSTTKSVKDSDETSSSSPSLEGADDDKVCPPVLNSFLSSRDLEDGSHRVHARRQSRGRHTTKSTNNSTESKKSKPSGLKVQNIKLAESDTKKSLNQTKVLKDTTGISKTGSVIKLEVGKIQHTEPATMNTANVRDSPKTRSISSSRASSREPISLTQLPKSIETNGSSDPTEAT